MLRRLPLLSQLVLTAAACSAAARAADAPPARPNIVLILADDK